MTDSAGDLSALGKSVADAVGRLVAQRSCRPVATYRLQLARDTLTFRDAAAVAPYLDELGVSHLYVSPCLKTRSGSAHGYSVVDFGQLDAALGGADDYRAMVEALHGRRLGQILDVVPNHMSATPPENPWWNDVLENGPGSPYAAYFDVDWRPVKEELQDKILLPMLGEQYGQVLEAGELQLELSGGAFFIRYFQTLLPLEPRTYTVVLAHRLDELKATLPAESDAVRELESILTALEHLPGYKDTDPGRMAERQREKEVVKDRLGRRCHRSTAVAEFVARNVQEFNGCRDDPPSYDRLDKLLDAQVYRLAHWKAAGDEINYRRFFDVNDLAAVCMEDPQVFEESHRLVFDLLGARRRRCLADRPHRRPVRPHGISAAAAMGLRSALGRRGTSIKCSFRSMGRSHSPMKSPATASRGRLREKKTPGQRRSEPGGAGLPSGGLGRAAISRPPPPPPPTRPPPRFAACVPLAWSSRRSSVPRNPCPNTGPSPAPPATTSSITSTGCSSTRPGLSELGKVYSRFLDQKLDFREVAYQSKLADPAGDDGQRGAPAGPPPQSHFAAAPAGRATSRSTRCGALREILACFPVYRTYIHEGHVAERDRQFVCRAVAQAKRRNPALDAAVFDFVRDVLVAASFRRRWTRPTGGNGSCSWGDSSRPPVP